MQDKVPVVSKVPAVRQLGLVQKIPDLFNP
jgi:hypothetical protein